LNAEQRLNRRSRPTQRTTKVLAPTPGGVDLSESVRGERPMSARLFAAVIVAAVAISISAGEIARATMPPPKPGASAEPKSTRQTGFPEELYKLGLAADNPQTSAKVALGKALFFDARHSVDNTVACANCHDPDKGFADQLPT